MWIKSTTMFILSRRIKNVSNHCYSVMYRRHSSSPRKLYYTNRSLSASNTELNNTMCDMIEMRRCLRYSHVHPYATNVSGRMRNETIAFDRLTQKHGWAKKMSEVVAAHERIGSHWNPVSVWCLCGRRHERNHCRLVLASPREYPWERQTLEEKDGLRCLNTIAGWKIVSKHLVNGWWVHSIAEFNEQLLDEWSRAVSFEWFFRFEWIFIGGNIAWNSDEVVDGMDGLMHAANAVFESMQLQINYCETSAAEREVLITKTETNAKTKNQRKVIGKGKKIATTKSMHKQWSICPSRSTSELVHK